VQHQFVTYFTGLLDRWPHPPITSKLAQDIVRLSDAYAKQSKLLPTVWSTSDLTAAYLHYFTPLNLLRLIRVIHEAKDRQFLTGLHHLLDFGSGPGTADLAFFEQGVAFQSRLFVECGRSAPSVHRDLLKHFNFDTTNATWSEKFGNTNSKTESTTLGVFSYSLNELAELPELAYKLEALMIVEPSTQEHGRRLQELRQKLIAKGYFIWAPCAHQDSCPLLNHSKTDWCHTRMHVQLPEWMQQLEAQLPMKNQSLTFSYLLARKTQPPTAAKAQVRIIGDTLYERGKVRQAICRGPEREFFSWLTRAGEPTPIERGRLIDWPLDAVKKGDEWRLTD
jgi:ribosomal protein RSM22 (predicted rRNA methylase)